MVNLKGNVATLKPYEGKWRSGKTQTIRVPIALAEEILDVARQMDAGNTPVTEDDIADNLRLLRMKIDARVPGYKANSASKLIAALKIIISKL
jgi:hypothetical protein